MLLKYACFVSSLTRRQARGPQAYGVESHYESPARMEKNLYAAMFLSDKEDVVTTKLGTPSCARESSCGTGRGEHGGAEVRRHRTKECHAGS